ncbi:MAG: restriction endonuclease subunit S [Actinomycetota bacterium]
MTSDAKERAVEIGNGDLPKLPSTWRWLALGQIAEVKLGKMLSPKAYEPGLHQLPYLRNENIRWGTINFGDVKLMGFKASELDRYRVRPGDLIVCEGGEPGRCAVLKPTAGEWMYQKALHRVRVYDEVANPYFIQLCLDYLVRQNLIPRASETTIKHLPLEKMLVLQIPVPPHEEQQRIVAEIERLFSILGAGVAALKRVQANLKRYRASVLQAACEGRLVPTEAALARAEGRDYEPSTTLLERLQHSVNADTGRRRIEGATREKTFSRPIPEGWSWASLKEVAELKGGITKGQKRLPDTPLHQVPYLRVANVQRGYLDLREVKTIEATDQEIEALRLIPGDILFNEGGDRDKLGRGWIWDGRIPDCIHQNHVFRARLLSQDIHPKFISWYGNTIGQRYFWDEGKHTTNLASINLTKLGNLPVPIPPYAEQLRIVTEGERRLSVIDAADGAITAGLKRAERLRQSILKRAFEGKLVPQDPNDEPASVLLERIRAERAASEHGKSRTAGRGRKGKAAVQPAWSWARESGWRQSKCK